MILWKMCLLNHNQVMWVGARGTIFYLMESKYFFFYLQMSKHV